MINQLRVDIPTVDNTRSVCDPIVLSQCVTMKRSSDNQVVMLDGETLNDTLERMNMTNNSLRNRIAALESKINSLMTRTDELRRQLEK